MASDAVKYMPIHGGTTTAAADIKSFFSALKPKKTSTFAYAFVITFVSFTLFFAFSPSPNSSSPWFSNIFSSSTATSPASDDTSGSHFSSIFSYILPNVTSTKPTNRSSDATDPISVNSTSPLPNSNLKNGTLQAPAPENHTPIAKNGTFTSPIVNGTNPVVKNNTSSHPLLSDKSSAMKSSNHSQTTTNTNQNSEAVKRNQTTAPAPSKAAPVSDLTANSNSNSSTASTPGKQTKNDDLGSLLKQEIEKWSESLKDCEFFDGEWIKDDSYPLYKPGSCKLIDEQFNCISNGRPDKDFQKLKWKPKKCSLPRYFGWFNFFHNLIF